MLFFGIENAEISQIKGVLVLKGIFSETTMCVYLNTKLQVFSINLTRFSQEVILRPFPTAKQAPKKPTQIRLKKFKNSIYVKLYRELLFL